jgi:hypothetical protein
VADPTWSWREQAILEAVVRLERDNVDTRLWRPSKIATESGLADRDAALGLVALIQARYMVGSIAGERRLVANVRVTSLTERARRATGQWPSERAYDDLVELLEQRIASTEDEDKQSKLRTVLSSVQAVGRDVLTDVLAKVIEHQAGMG